MTQVIKQPLKPEHKDKAGFYKHLLQVSLGQGWPRTPYCSNAAKFLADGQYMVQINIIPGEDNGLIVTTKAVLLEDFKKQFIEGKDETSSE